jgi:hypothetical protein
MKVEMFPGCGSQTLALQHYRNLTHSCSPRDRIETPDRGVRQPQWMNSGRAISSRLTSLWLHSIELSFKLWIHDDPQDSVQDEQLVMLTPINTWSSESCCEFPIQRNREATLAHARLLVTRPIDGLNYLRILSFVFFMFAIARNVTEICWGVVLKAEAIWFEVSSLGMHRDMRPLKWRFCAFTRRNERQTAKETSRGWSFGLKTRELGNQIHYNSIILYLSILLHRFITWCLLSVLLGQLSHSFDGCVAATTLSQFIHYFTIMLLLLLLSFHCYVSAFTKPS